MKRKSIDVVKDFIESLLNNRVLYSTILEDMPGFSCAYQFKVSSLLILNDLQSLSKFCNTIHICVSPSFSVTSMMLTIYFD